MNLQYQLLLKINLKLFDLIDLKNLVDTKRLGFNTY